MLGKTRGCRCGHHWLATLLGWIALIAAILFLYTIWANGTVFGFGSEAWFQHMVVFSLAMFSLSACSCCCGKECCGSCPVNKQM